MKVGVIMGGISSERDVSLMTGEVMLAHLDRDKYEVTPIVLTERDELIGKVKGIDIALLALHGSYGEDGTVQGTLETLGVPYTGSGVLSSSVCMDKDLSKKLLRAEGIKTPDWLCWNSMEEYSAEAVEQLGYPVIVKPNSGGSSIGTQLVPSEELLHAAVQDAFRWDDSVLIESYIKGEEITCSILDGELLPIIGIRSAHSEWFDYQAKYADGGAEEQVIALPAEVEACVRAAAQVCYRILRCSVYGRVDMMLRDGIPYVLEVNTLPGMTTNSLLPKSAAAAGISFSQLLDRIIACSWEEHTRDRGVMGHVE
ncbi:D-alanine--D-alanine ligase [Paenibacillus mendelii]|uniref:D-alanine--D-alanine ligase n=1 Tax=Paenibacillus mendelii TaxID=206163 RepID=A0ABV6JLR8_9BACL|nr:D-alanine--D-alanine ligase [Paenibacillus mendelii]MCQ6563024.1 D-alanine--D-alanine ligase [Paenibacillus mendelii]